MKLKSFLGLAVALGGCHFLASQLIVPFTLWCGDALSAGTVKNTLMGALHFLTKLLYYPILSHALYPRHWFPGTWIFIPILINSLLCGFLLACVVFGWRRIRSGR